jgi:hypothetical protein
LLAVKTRVGKVEGHHLLAIKGAPV